MYQTKVFYICPYVAHKIYKSFIIDQVKLTYPLLIHWPLEYIL